MLFQPVRKIIQVSADHPFGTANGKACMHRNSHEAVAVVITITLMKVTNILIHQNSQIQGVSNFCLPKISLNSHANGHCGHGSSTFAFAPTDSGYLEK